MPEISIQRIPIYPQEDTYPVFGGYFERFLVLVNVIMIIMTYEYARESYNLLPDQIPVEYDDESIDGIIYGPKDGIYNYAGNQLLIFIMFLFFVYTFWLFSDLCTKYWWKRAEYFRITIEFMVLILESSQAYQEYVVIQEETNPSYSNGGIYMGLVDKLLLLSLVLSGITFFLLVKGIYNEDEINDANAQRFEYVNV